MGWSIDILRPELNKIFKEAKRNYRLIRPQSASVSVEVEYPTIDTEDDLPMRYKQRIAALFPDFCYVIFVPQPMSQETREQATWDLEVQQKNPVLT